jgi:hypothetical protein
MAARVRERALADTRGQVNLLMKELATDRAELRARDARIADLESQVEKYRIQLTTVMARAVTRNRSVARKRVVPRPKPKERVLRKRRVISKPSRRRPKR